MHTINYTLALVTFITNLPPFYLWSIQNCNLSRFVKRMYVNKNQSNWSCTYLRIYSNFPSLPFLFRCCKRWSFRVCTSGRRSTLSLFSPSLLTLRLWTNLLIGNWSFASTPREEKRCWQHIQVVDHASMKLLFFFDNNHTSFTFLHYWKCSSVGNSGWFCVSKPLMRSIHPSRSILLLYSAPWFLCT